MQCCRPKNHQKSRLRGRRRKKQRWKRRWQPWRLCAVCTIKLLKSESVCTSLGFGRNAHSKVLVHLTCRSSAIGSRVLFRNACNHRVRTSTSHILSSLASALADHVNLIGEHGGRVGVSANEQKTWFQHARQQPTSSTRQAA